MLPLAIGLMAVGGAGAAYGLMKKPQQYNSPNYDDIDLARDNPALYAELQKYEKLGNVLEAQYNQRKTGPNNAELRMRDQALNDQRNNLQSRGALGGSTSLLAERDLNARFQEEVMARAFQEQQAMMAQRLAQRQAQAQMFGNAQQGIMANMNQAAMMDYQGRQAQDQARNQFFTGLMGAGAGMYGASQQAGAMNANTAALQQQQAAYQGVPGGAPMSSPANYYQSSQVAPAYYGNPYQGMVA